MLKTLEDCVREAVKIAGVVSKLPALKPGAKNRLCDAVHAIRMAVDSSGHSHDELGRFAATAKSLNYKPSGSGPNHTQYKHASGHTMTVKKNGQWAHSGAGGASGEGHDALVAHLGKVHRGFTPASVSPSKTRMYKKGGNYWFEHRGKHHGPWDNKADVHAYAKTTLGLKPKAKTS